MMLTDVAASFSDWATFGIFVLALGSAALAFHRWLRKNVADPLKSVPALQEGQLLIRKEQVRMHTRVDGIESTLNTVRCDLDVVKSEVSNNGGASVKDVGEKSLAILQEQQLAQ